MGKIIVRVSFRECFFYFVIFVFLKSSYILRTPWNFKTMQSLSALSADITDIDLINIAGQIVS